MQPNLKAEEYQARLREAAERANRFLKARNYQVSQKNGQRISELQQLESGEQSSSENQLWQDEVFVGRIPRDLFEDELLPFMERAGPVRVIRLMMDFSGTTRGYAFVRYLNSEDATYACEHLSDTKIRNNSDPGVGIKLSFDNKGLTFSGLPPDTSAASLKAELCRILDGVDHVKLLKDSSPAKRKQPGTAGAAGAASLAAPPKQLTFEVQFKSHFCATQARRKLIPMLNKSGIRQYTVDWARPEPPAMNKARSPIGSRSSTVLGSLINQHQPSIPTAAVASPLNQPGQLDANCQQRAVWDSILGHQESLLNAAILHDQAPINKGPRPGLGLINASQSISNLNNNNNDSNNNISHGPIWNSFLGSSPQNQQQQAQESFFSGGATGSGSAAAVAAAARNSLLNLDNIEPRCDPMRSITLANINLHRSEIDKLRQVFELNGLLKINRISPGIANGTFTIEFNSPEEATLIYEAVLLMPASFGKLAVPGIPLIAF